VVDQAKVAETDGAPDSPPRAAARNFVELLHDVLVLAELQGQLLVVEAGQELRKTLPPTIAIVCGIVLAFSCFPVAILCAALALTEATYLSPAQSLLLALTGTVVMAAVLIGGSLWYLRRSIQLLRRSRTEWNLNVRWIRSVLLRLASSRTPREDWQRKTRD
jgi:integral membrane sensor domain MASE1